MPIEVFFLTLQIFCGFPQKTGLGKAYPLSFGNLPKLLRPSQEKEKNDINELQMELLIHYNPPKSKKRCADERIEYRSYLG